MSHSELSLLTMMAAVYDFYLEEHEKALAVYTTIRTCYERDYITDIDLANARVFGAYTATAYFNIPNTLYDLKRYDECLALCDKGMEISLRHEDLNLYIRLSALRGLVLGRLGRIEEAKAQYKKYLLFAYLLDGYDDLIFERDVKAYIEEFGEAPDFTIK